MKPSDDRAINPFIFVGQVVTGREDLIFPVEIGENAHLQLAKGDYIQVVKHYLKPYLEMSAFGRHGHNIYEKRAIENEGGYSFEDLPSDKWQYWIVTHTDQMHEENLNTSLELADISLTPLFDVYGSQGHSHRLNSLVAGIYLENRSMAETRDVTVSHIENIKHVRNLLDEFDEEKRSKYSTIEKALKDFELLKEVPRNSPFKFLGMFSILELLLTHDSKNSDSSINGQLQSKISLLNSRFDEKLDFQNYFGGPDTFTNEMYVQKMYAYRSAIAHGSVADFDDKLQHLKTSENVAKFLYILLKKVLVHSLVEPQLITDLKKC
ncbi:MAG: hypothetical protein KUG81_06855 [Gammaproteobacteria bacterium]|nr:hypothetical protein [Gammaproteobacteria bacterium]